MVTRTASRGRYSIKFRSTCRKKGERPALKIDVTALKTADDSKGSALDPDTVAHNTTVFSFQTTDTVLPMLPASAGATAAKVLVCFLYYAIC
jgi:hypothetical protein